MRERPVTVIPKSIIFLILISVSAQILWHHAQQNNQAVAKNLMNPPSASSLQLLSFGDPITLAKVLMLWLQAFDNQPGISIPFNDLDYNKVQRWLTSILLLDPRGQYPLKAAAHLYANVPNEAKQRQILDFIYQQYLLDPKNRWPWLAHAAIVAKHRTKDLSLALKFSQAIADETDSNAIPHWASQMNLVILEDMGEFETVQYLIGGLLKSGKINDPNEINFLNRRLTGLQIKIN